MARRSTSFPVVIGLLVFATGCLIGWIGRYQLIEPDDLYQVCLGAQRPWWCEVRQDLIAATFTVRGIYGWIAAGSAVASWLLDGPIVAAFVMLALLAGGMGLFLYAAAGAALGVLLAFLRLARLREIMAKPPEFRA
jgi:hypothetical protein